MEALNHFIFDITPFVQLLIAIVLGALLGTERTLAHKKAGIRTYGLVAMGACLFVITALGALHALAGITSADIMRVVAGVVTGVGFLGTGVIIFKDTELTGGLTTAAGLWVAAGIGVAVGFQFYALAVMATFLTLIVFTIFWYLERGLEKVVNGNGLES